MIVAYDLRGILAYGQSDADVTTEALTYWDGKTPFRISVSQATPALEALIAQEGKSAVCGECSDGRLGTAAETPSATGKAPAPGRGPTHFSRHVHGTVSTDPTEEKSE
jgi:hypothetical protein